MHYTEYFTLRDCSGFLQISSHMSSKGIEFLTKQGYGNGFHFYKKLTAKNNNNGVSKYCFKGLPLHYLCPRSCQIRSFWLHLVSLTVTRPQTH